MQHIAVEAGSELLFDRLVTAVADCVLQLRVGVFGDLVEDDLAVWADFRRFLHFCRFHEHSSYVS